MLLLQSATFYSRRSRDMGTSPFSCAAILAHQTSLLSTCFSANRCSVEHHSYLKDGGARLTEFISRLNSFESLEWTGLHEILTKSYLEREISNEITLCRLFTNHHVIENSAERERT